MASSPIKNPRTKYHEENIAGTASLCLKRNPVMHTIRIIEAFIVNNQRALREQGFNGKQSV